MQDCKGLGGKSGNVAEKAISELLHSKIVPDLLKSGRTKLKRSSRTMETAHNYEFHQSDVASLAKFLIAGDVNEAEELVASHLVSGCRPSAVILSLFAPVAQLLGEKWCSDTASFAEVTLGMMELHTLLRSVEVELGKEFSPSRNPGSILFTVMPDDTHIFGVSVLQSFFAASGWHVDVLLDPTKRKISDRVLKAGYDIVGISVSANKDISLCKDLIKSLREKSAKQNISYMVGGLPFILDPTLSSKVRADYVATDAFEALAIAASICNKSQSVEPSNHYA